MQKELGGLAEEVDNKVLYAAFRRYHRCLDSTGLWNRSVFSLSLMFRFLMPGKELGKKH